ncbi:hypothetical protein AOQ84DRAFT_302418, partial [Glonium stellatum]
ITAKEVRDKGNATTLSKGIVIWQASWMIMQVIVRTAARFPVTLLELHTVLHAFCAVSMYIMWWHKPLDIETSTIVPLHHDDEIVSRSAKSTTDADPTSPLTVVVKKPASEQGTPARSPRPTSLVSRRPGFQWRKKLRRTALVIPLVGLIFGGLHLAAWNNKFPSYLEQLLWEISAVITTATWYSFIVSLNLYPILAKLSENPTFRVFIHRTLRVCFGVGLIPVVFARFFLLVESFASMRLLLKRSYEIPTWVSIWPHAS